ncbi:MBL fold metallo-hydrolase [Halobacteriales archaeon QS_1_68_44]|nr:MAG: MBL fold metallo-hydrolase [Halobacteriales archaeon QS_1_68_44]
MGIGDVYEVDGMADCYYVDTGMYDTAEYGSVYLLDAERPAIIDSGIGTNYERVLAGSGATFLSDPERIWEGTKAAVGDQIRYYTEPKPVPVDAIEPIHDGTTVDLGSTSVTAHHTPGHAFHQVVFHDREASAMFIADAAGIYVPTLDAVRETSPPPGFDLEQVVADARSIARMTPETLCYAHFGDAPADDRLSEYVDVVTRWVEAVARKRAELADDPAVVEHFVEATDIGEVWGDAKADGEVAMNVRGVLQYLDEREA